MQDENCKKKWITQSEIVSWKKLPTVIVGLFSLSEKPPTKEGMIAKVLDFFSDSK